MGYLHFGGSDYEIEDRALAHVKVAASAKLRRKETFLINWTRPPSDGSGRATLLISPNTPLIFRFASSTTLELNKAWVQALLLLANTAQGMHILSEEEAESYLRSRA